MSSEKDDVNGLPAVNYRRVSSRPQTKKFGLPYQKKVQGKRENELRFNIVADIEEKGVSGRVFPREGLEKLKQDVHKHSAKIINVYMLNRLGRRLFKLMGFIGELIDLGVIAIVTKGDVLFLDDSTKKFDLIYQALEAERQWEQLIENTSGGTLLSIDVGEFPFRPPFGSIKKNGKLEYIEERIPIIQDAFRFSETIGKNIEKQNIHVYSKAAEELNRTYSASLKEIFKHRKKKKFDGSDVKRITSQRVYAGWIQYKGKDIKEEEKYRLVSEKRWQRIKKIREIINQRYKTKNPEDVVPGLLIEKRGLRYTQDIIPHTVVLCPLCNSIPSKNGTDTIGGIPFQKNVCSNPNCNHEYLPAGTKMVIDTFKGIELKCTYCHDYENFKIIKIDVGPLKYLYVCKTCRTVQGNNFHPDKKMRKPSQRLLGGIKMPRWHEGSTLDDFL